MRQQAVNDFESFITIYCAFQNIGSCHRELCFWLQSTVNYKLVLWPRDHCKSRYAAFYTAWQIIRNPAITIIYGSANAEKAEEQLRFVKTILTQRAIFRDFPGLVHEEEGTRKLWNNTNIIVDHPLRSDLGVVDSTVMTCGVGKSITGKHCDLFVLDDIVVKKNNTETGRKEVRGWFSEVASVVSAAADMLIVGTRYHPADLYADLISMSSSDEYDKDGNEVTDAKALFSVNQRNVEEGGEFLWPRYQDEKGRWFGFNFAIIQKKKEMYDSVIDFYSQYYNNPNDSSNSPIGRDLFKYYDKNDLFYNYNQWFVNQEPLVVAASVDPAFTTSDKADWTGITIGGSDKDGNKYLLHAERIKTDRPSVIEQRLIALYNQFHFTKLRIEAVAGQRAIARVIEDNIKRKGVRIPVDYYIPTHVDGNKDMRILAILEPEYRVGKVFHYQGGNVQLLEEELTQIKPLHDDLKDSWMMTVDILNTMVRPNRNKNSHTNVTYHPKFGGVIR